MVDITIDATENVGDGAQLFVYNPDDATSATGGCLRPAVGTPLLEGKALHDFIQGWICCVTGLRGAFVRPRLQEEPPNIPEGDWCAFGIVDRVNDEFPAEVHHSENGGWTEMRTHQVLTILASFYGDGADSYASILKDGMKLSQNREELVKANIDVLEANRLVTIPEVIKNKWVNRVDLTFRLVRQVVRGYKIKNIESAQAEINSDIGGTLNTNVVTISQN